MPACLRPPAAYATLRYSRCLCRAAPCRSCCPRHAALLLLPAPRHTAPAACTALVLLPVPRCAGPAACAAPRSCCPLPALRRAGPAACTAPRWSCCPHCATLVLLPAPCRTGPAAAACTRRRRRRHTAPAACAVPLLLLLPRPVGRHRWSWLVRVMVGSRGWLSVVVNCCSRWLLWPPVVGRCRLSVIPVTAVVTLPVVSAAPSMAEGTAGVEPAGGAEKAHTARPEALEPRAHRGAGDGGAF